MRPALLVVVVALAACGGKTPAGSGPAVTPPIDAPLPPLAAECPATYAAVPAGQACEPPAGHALSCAYPEGACSCMADYPCSGVEMTREEMAALPIVWQCTPTPPAVRPDGCPGVEPSGACSRDGQRCSYGDCCYRELTCQHGEWQMTGGGCPP